MKYKYKGFAVCDMCEKKRKLFIVGKNTPIELDLCDECIKRVISPILGCKPRKVISLKKI